MILIYNVVMIPKDSVKFKTSRAGGPGGQRVNRRATKVQARLKIGDLNIPDAKKNHIRRKLAKRINKNDELTIESEEERSQARNKKRALEVMDNLIKSALRVKKRRVPTRPSRSAEEKRLKEKKIKSEKKKSRLWRM